MSQGKREGVHRRWRCTVPESRQVELLVSELSISPLLASLLLRAGMTEPDECRRFLQPRLASLEDPFRITHLDVAVERLLCAVRDGESIGLVGDYDVDGITSTVLLVSVLRLFGVSPKYLIPRRLEEGYGLTEAALGRLMAEQKPDLLIALDCGTNAVEEVAALRASDIDVIIVDHHQSKGNLPEDCILINPHVYNGEEEPWSQLCAVGLVFKFVHGFIKRLRDEGDATAMSLELRDFLDLVALGTIGDLVPLLKENRVFVHFGLRCLQESSRPGIRALLEVAGFRPDQALVTSDVSFRLGPRINAGGRVADASVPVELLLGEDYGTCLQVARKLETSNRERQKIERALFEEALEQARALPGDSAGLVVYGAEWHQGVLGIVAGRLAREFHRPTIVLGFANGVVRGSGRSILGICLQKTLAHCDALLTKWGGHSMAVGVCLEVDQIESFRVAFSKAVEACLSEGIFPDPEIEIAAWIESDQLGPALLEELNCLHPFGQAHPMPIFGLASVTLADPPSCFGQNHCRFRIYGAGGQRLFAVGWNLGDHLPPADRPIDLAIRLAWNYWNGSRSPQAEVVAWRLAHSR